MTIKGARIYKTGKQSRLYFTGFSLNTGQAMWTFSPSSGKRYNTIHSIITDINKLQKQTAGKVDYGIEE